LGAGLGLCGILAHQLQASKVVMTDGDVNTLVNMRENVVRNGIELQGMEEHTAAAAANTTTTATMDCPQLIWGQQLPEFLRQYASGDDDENGQFEVVLAADIIYVTEILEPLWETVDALLAPQGLFLLAYARRNVPIDLVLEHAAQRGFTWSCPKHAEGVFLFRRQETSNA
jgi:predicted nicotinamide N-methyase